MDEYEKFVSELRLPPTQSDAASVYAFSLHKSGSTLLYNMLAELAPHVGQPYFSLPDELFKNGIPTEENIKGTEKLFRSTGYIYGGFRFFPEHYRIPRLNEHRKILLIRNPLDIMVSVYFSRKISHVIPNKGALRTILLNWRKEAVELSIDEYVQRNFQYYYQNMLSYKSILDDNNCKVFRYEDIIYAKKDFLSDIVNFYIWHVDDEIITEIASKYDVFPKKEDESSHIRQVHPGNYKKHLSKDTQLFLEDKFNVVLQAFGYKLDSRNISSMFNKIGGEK